MQPEPLGVDPEAVDAVEAVDVVVVGSVVPVPVLMFWRHATRPPTDTERARSATLGAADAPRCMMGPREA
jgi:hypothetical protein